MAVKSTHYQRFDEKDIKERKGKKRTIKIVKSFFGYQSKELTMPTSFGGQQKHKTWKTAGTNDASRSWSRAKSFSKCLQSNWSTIDTAIEFDRNMLLVHPASSENGKPFTELWFEMGFVKLANHRLLLSMTRRNKPSKALLKFLGVCFTFLGPKALWN